MTTTKQWDYLNRLESISSACSAYSAVSFSYGYNAANQRTNAILSDNSRWSFQYHSLGQVTTASKRWPDNTPVAGQQFGYTFDDIGNRLSTINNGHIAAYTNNTLNQITSRDVPGFAQVIGSANSNATVTLWADNGAYTQTSRKGNYFFGELPVNNSTGAVWLAITNLAVLRNGTNADYVASSVGRQLLPQTPQTFLHDADGNLTNDGKWSYIWDAENRLTEIESGAGIPPAAQYRLEFAYDWQSRRTQKIVYTNDGSGFAVCYTNCFLYDGWNLIAEFGPDGTLLRSHVWGTDASGTMQGAGGVGGLLATIIHTGPYAGTYFPLYDGNHNIMAYIRASDGAIVSRYEYGPFGELIRASGPMAREFNFLFSTKYYDWETGFYYYGYRYYDPITGRWLSRDPIEEQGGLNLYASVQNDSVNNYDPAGQIHANQLIDVKDGDKTIGFVRIVVYARLPSSGKVTRMSDVGAQLRIEPTLACPGCGCFKWRQYLSQLSDNNYDPAPDRADSLNWRYLPKEITEMKDVLDIPYKTAFQSEWYPPPQDAPPADCSYPFRDTPSQPARDSLFGLEPTAKKITVSFRLELVKLENCGSPKGGTVLLTIPWGYWYTKDTNGLLNAD